MRHDPVLFRARTFGAAQRTLRLDRCDVPPPARDVCARIRRRRAGGRVDRNRGQRLYFQHERHPAPFFAARPPAVGSPPSAAAAPPPQAARADNSTSVAVLPPTRPANLGVVRPAASAGGPVEPAPSARGADAIGEILRADTAKDGEKQVLEAQNALIKLGYVLRADGSPGAATSAALHDFERAHSLPITTDVTPRLLKQLTAALAAAER